MQDTLNAKKLLLLGTGGTIAGLADSPKDYLGYRAAQLSLVQLLDRVPALGEVLRGCRLHSEQVAQTDSKDMGFDIWRDLAQRVAQHLAQDDVSGVLITHGSDTLEETAYFLHATLPAALINTKPVVLTCAMRPASAHMSDGPQNLFDAINLALSHGAHGVLVLCAGVVHGALEVQKNHPYRLDAFGSGDAAPLAYVEAGRIRLLRPWPLVDICQARISPADLPDAAHWPRVEIVLNYAGCGGEVVDALLHQLAGAVPLRGLVVAGTGNGTMHHNLEAALRRARQAGVQVLRATRCAQGRVLAGAGDEFADSEGLSPVKARVALMLKLLRASVGQER